MWEREVDWRMRMLACLSTRAIGAPRAQVHGSFLSSGSMLDNNNGCTSGDFVDSSDGSVTNGGN